MTRLDGLGRGRDWTGQGGAAALGCGQQSRGGRVTTPPGLLCQARHARGPLSNSGELGEVCSLWIRVRVPGLMGSWSDREKHAIRTLPGLDSDPPGPCTSLDSEPRTLPGLDSDPPRTLRRSGQ